MPQGPADGHSSTHGVQIRHPAHPFVPRPSKGRLWFNAPSDTLRPFKSAPKPLNRHERRQYATRHTRATLSLMPWMNPVFIASLLGHCVEMSPCA